jgi:hypothetical protein
LPPGSQGPDHISPTTECGEGKGGGHECCPTLKNADVGGVHDADGEPGKSGGVVGEVPGYVGTVPD